MCLPMFSRRSKLKNLRSCRAATPMLIYILLRWCEPGSPKEVNSTLFYLGMGTWRREYRDEITWSNLLGRARDRFIERGQYVAFPWCGTAKSRTGPLYHRERRASQVA